MYHCTWITFETPKRYPELFFGASLNGPRSSRRFDWTRQRRFTLVDKLLKYILNQKLPRLYTETIISLRKSKEKPGATSASQWLNLSGEMDQKKYKSRNKRQQKYKTN